MARVTSAIMRMVEVDRARFRGCWERAFRLAGGLPRLDRILAQHLGDAAERTFVLQRLSPSRFRFGVAADRFMLRLGFDASGRELGEQPPWPRHVSVLLERAAVTRSIVQLILKVQTSHGELISSAIDLYPFADDNVNCCGFAGFAHAFERSSDGQGEFGLIEEMEISSAVLARPIEPQMITSRASI